MDNKSDQGQENLIGKGQLQGDQTNRWRISFIFIFISVREKYAKTWSRNSGRYSNNIILGENNFMK